MATKKAKEIVAEVVEKKAPAVKKAVAKKAPAVKKAVEKKASVAKKAGQPRGHRVFISYKGEPGKQVFVAGSFNEWNPSARALADVKGTGDYSVCFLLKSGSYQYKLVVDGQWILDPTNSNLAPNDFGGNNNVLDVTED